MRKISVVGRCVNNVPKNKYPKIKAKIKAQTPLMRATFTNALLLIDNGLTNKAIRDGKYLARHMPVLGNVHPIKIEKFDIFRDVISLLARVVILLIDTATQEVPMKNI